MAIRALRGATTVDFDTAEEVSKSTKELLLQMLERNAIEKEDLISILFTSTSDIHSAFPAAAARELGLGDVPLMCASELEIINSTPLCIRVMMHLESTHERANMRHVYLRGAKGLRDDLPE
ncbi:MAG: chorismate mutase [Acidimicrobiaceae bacterium]|nr:chorismate mutase [Acidimicrobiaceae bacterium]